MPDCMLVKLSGVHQPPSICYILTQKTEIVYIGETRHGMIRIRQHMQDKNFDDVFYVEVSDDLYCRDDPISRRKLAKKRLELEGALARAYHGITGVLPRYNKQVLENFAKSPKATNVFAVRVIETVLKDIGGVIGLRVSPEEIGCIQVDKVDSGGKVEIGSYPERVPYSEENRALWVKPSPQKPHPNSQIQHPSMASVLGSREFREFIQRQSGQQR